jgi:hypothetical protein
MFSKRLPRIDSLEACCAGINLASWEEEMAEKGERLSSESIPDSAASFLLGTSLPNCVVVDCTDAEAPAALYYQWMKRDIHIVTPNKKLLAGPLKRYDDVRHMTRNSYVQFYYEVRSQSCQLYFTIQGSIDWLLNLPEPWRRHTSSCLPCLSEHTQSVPNMKPPESARMGQLRGSHQLKDLLRILHRGDRCVYREHKRLNTQLFHRFKAAMV